MECCKTPMERLFSEIEKTESFQDSIGKKAIEELATKMSTESECEKSMTDTVKFFFSLSSEDAVATMDRMRKINYDQLIEAGQQEAADSIKKNEKEVDAVVKMMKDYADKHFKMPFHLAAALGKFEEVESMFGESPLSARNFVQAAPANSAAKIDCPMGDYPRYVPAMAPWKLRNAWSIRSRQRRQDSGCHFEQGPYDGIIRAWFTINPAIVAVVYLNGWGGRLAANNNHFFYKWWSLAPIGFTFWNMTMFLQARRF